MWILRDTHGEKCAQVVALACETLPSMLRIGEWVDTFIAKYNAVIIAVFKKYSMRFQSAAIGTF